MEVLLPPEQTCANCETQLTGKFCSSCGQEHFGHEPTLKELLSDVWVNTFSIDGRMVRTLKAMFASPGKLTQEYFEGRRVRYSTPFKLYLTCSAAFSWSRTSAISRCESSVTASRLLLRTLPRNQARC